MVSVTAHQKRGFTMNAKKRMITVAATIAAVALLFSVPAMAQGPERGNGYYVPGVPNGTYRPPVLDSPTDVIVGAIIGGLLIYAIESNRDYDDDRSYRGRDWDRDSDRDRYRDRDYRRYDRRWDGYDGYYPRHGRDR